MSNTLRLNITLFAASVVMLGSAIVLHAQNAATQPINCTGTWKWTTAAFNGDQETVLTLKQDDAKVTGTITGIGGNAMDIQEGAFKDGIVTFKTINDINGQKIKTDYTSTLHADSLMGKSETIFVREFEAKRSQ